MRSALSRAALLVVLFSASGWAAPIISGRPPYVVDSIPAPGKRFHVSVCFDSTWNLRVLHNWQYQQWSDSLIFRADSANGQVLDSIFLDLPNSYIPKGMSFAYGKLWLTVYDGRNPWTDYVYKMDTLGRTLGRFRSPFVYPAAGNGICFEGDKLWLSFNLDANWVSGFYQTDTLGNVLRFVRLPYDSIGIPSFLAYWPRAPQTLFVSTGLNSQHRLCQVTTDDTVARLLRVWPGPFPPNPGADNIDGSTFDHQGFFWANCTDYEWILKLDLGLTGVERGEPLLPEFPRRVRLYPPEPMPTSSAAVVRFELPGTARVQLSLVNIAGSRVRLLNDGVLRAGEYRVVWDGRNDQGQKVSSGVYFLKLEALGQSAVQRVVVVR